MFSCMDRIAPARIASILAGSSFLDRLDLSSPSTMERDRAALMIAAKIVDGLEQPEPMDVDRRQMALPIQ